MGINIRTKGQGGEREVCDMLNVQVYLLFKELGIPQPEKPVFQRNQNQSAVGGSDISNPVHLCIEVKRQEDLAINSWWNQCMVASRQFGGVPIVIFRQNGKRKWRVLMQGNIMYHCGQAFSTMRCEVDEDDFKKWVYNWMKQLIQSGEWKV